MLLLDGARPFALRRGDPVLYFIQRMRDEAHRFAGRYQRQRRSQALVKGVLDDVPGIGVKRRRQLLERFGSVAGIKRASFEDLAAMPGIGRVAEPGLVVVTPGSGEIMMPPVSVCHHVSTIGHDSLPMFL